MHVATIIVSSTTVALADLKAQVLGSLWGLCLDDVLGANYTGLKWCKYDSSRTKTNIQQSKIMNFTVVTV